MKDPMAQRFLVHVADVNDRMEGTPTTAVAEVIARTEDEASEVALSAPYPVRTDPQTVSPRPLRETGARVTKVVSREAFDIPTFVRWRTGGLKTS